jgi:hypothetical protein
MSRYVTHVQVWFYSEGVRPSHVVEKLLELGFRPVKGAYDFVYVHTDEELKKTPLGTAIVEIADAIHETLKGFKVLYRLDTHESEEEEDYIPLADIDNALAETRKEIEELENED